MGLGLGLGSVRVRVRVRVRFGFGFGFGLAWSCRPSSVAVVGGRWRRREHKEALLASRLQFSCDGSIPVDLHSDEGAEGGGETPRASDEGGVGAGSIAIATALTVISESLL